MQDARRCKLKGAMEAMEDKLTDAEACAEIAGVDFASFAFTPEEIKEAYLIGRKKALKDALKFKLKGNSDREQWALKRAEKYAEKAKDNVAVPAA